MIDKDAAMQEVMTGRAICFRNDCAVADLLAPGSGASASRSREQARSIWI